MNSTSDEENDELKNGDENNPNNEQVVKYTEIKKMREEQQQDAQQPKKIIRLPGYIEVEKELGRGGFGIVLQVVNTRTQARYALKIDTSNVNLLRREQQAYHNIHRCALGGRAVGLITTKLIQLPAIEGLLMDLKGPSVQKLVEQAPEQVTLSFVFDLGNQLLQRLRSIHQAGYVHCDVKPENILTGDYNHPRDMNLFYLIDLGLTTEYIRGTRHIKKDRSCRIAGSFYFMSLNASNGLVQTRRDDLESLAYTLIYLAKKELPWMQHRKTPSVNIQDFNRSVHCTKRDGSVEELCRGLPGTLRDFLLYARSISFDCKPNYVRWMKLFQKHQQHQQRCNNNRSKTRPAARKNKQ